MNKYAVIGGSGLKNYQNKNIFFLQRHENNVPPHKIDHDYINLNNIITFYNETAKHIIPEINRELREKINNTASIINMKVIKRGIYFQTMGPRFETRAEIKMLSHFAYIVGMTMSHEASLSQEAGLKYAAICMVDNFANGINRMLKKETWEQAQKENLPKIIKLLDNLFKI